MQRSDVIERLKGTEPKLRALGVGALYLFGSYSRDDSRADSDVDLFVDPAPDSTLSFIPYMEALTTIQDALGRHRQVGYSTRDGLSPYIRHDVERTALQIF